MMLLLLVCSCLDISIHYSLLSKNINHPKTVVFKMGGGKKRKNRNKVPPSQTIDPPPNPEVVLPTMVDLSMDQATPAPALSLDQATPPPDSSLVQDTPTPTPGKIPSQLKVQFNPEPHEGRNNTALCVPHYRSFDDKKKHLGTAGKKINVRVNHFEMKINLKHVYLYDVTITSDVWKGREARKGDKELSFRALEALKKNYDKFPNPFCVVYDGLKQAFSAQKLPFGPSEIFEGQVTVNRVADLPDMITLKIKLRLLRKIDISGVLQDYIRFGTTSNRPQEAINIVNIIFGHLPQLTQMTVGRNILSEEEDGKLKDIGGGKVLWTGVFPTFRPAWKLFLNVDMVNKPGYDATPTLDFIQKSLNDWPRKKLSEFNAKDFRVAESAIQNLKVRFNRPDNAQRDYRVNKFGPAANKPNVIDKDGKKMSIEKYFDTEYNHEIKHPSLPTLHVGSLKRSIYLPMELTEIKKQVCPVAKKLNDKETAVMIKHTAVGPQKRQEEIINSLTNLNSHLTQKGYAEAFQIKVSNQMSVIPARILDPPGLLYRNQSGQETGDDSPKCGKWLGKYNFLKCASLTHWGVLNMSSRLSHRILENFVDILYKEGQKRGLNVDYPKYHTFESRGLTPEELENKFKALVDDVEKDKKKKPDLIMVIVDSRGTNEYNLLKHYGDMVLNILTQFVLKKNVEKQQMATLHNICLKINSKLGGTNLSLDKASIPVWMHKPCMIMGGDVTHPSPDKTNEMPSIAALVGSQDAKASVYNLELSLQRRGQVVEVIEETERMAKSLLMKFHLFYKKKQKPSTIVYYRDGVSEGQFQDVLNKELSAIRRACASLEEGYQPHIVFIVAQKRHKTRMFPENPRETMLKSGNVMPGTVVDQEITHPTEHNFFLASHEGIQGTTKPTCYHKLWDDWDMSSDELQKLTFYLCHIYSRCERSVSYPAPTYYAHLAAERAKCYYLALQEKGQSIDSKALQKLTETKLTNNFV